MSPAPNRAPGRLPQRWKPLAAFSIAFAVWVAGTQIALRTVPALEQARRRAAAIEYPDSTWYLAFKDGPQLDHYVLFHGLGRSIESARAADILVLGSSRTQFGLPDAPLRAFERRHGVKIFHLGFGFSEPNAFPLEIIEKFDLRPKLVIVNADGFTTARESTMAAEVRSKSRWRAAMILFESFASSEVMPWLTTAIPRFVAPLPKPYLLRSTVTGSWRPVHWPHRDTPFSDNPFPVDLETWLPEARRFKEAMDRRGARIILTCIPANPELCNPERTRELARRLGVAAIVPWPPRLKMNDRYHLCQASGERFANAFLHELARSPELAAVTRR